MEAVIAITPGTTPLFSQEELEEAHRRLEELKLFQEKGNKIAGTETFGKPPYFINSSEMEGIRSLVPQPFSGNKSFRLPRIW